MLSDFSVASLLTSGVGSGAGHGVQLLTLVSGCHTRSGKGGGLNGATE